MKLITLYGERIPQREITVYLENDDSYDTTFNGSIPEIVTNYFNVPFYYTDSTGTRPVRVRAIVFHNEPILKPFPNSERRERLVKIWNLTDAEMKRDDLMFRTRVEVEVTSDDFKPASYPDTYRTSWAYADSSRFDRF